MYYHQCILEKHQAGELIRHVSYVPDKYAKIGKVLKIKNGYGWVDGWSVVAVGPKRESSAVEANERDYLRQRAASDRMRN